MKHSARPDKEFVWYTLAGDMVLGTEIVAVISLFKSRAEQYFGQ
jgi:hypothetical protein